jgi:class 3 adenylate cyclase/GAF domain-containing protein
MRSTHLQKTPGEHRDPLQQRLHLAFGFLFLLLAGGLLFFSMRYDLLHDRYLPFFFIALLIFALTGFGMLNGMLRRISEISKNLTLRTLDLPEPQDPKLPADELQAIAESFQLVHSNFNRVAQQLEKKTSEISVLKDLSELCHITVDPEEILCITLERALLLTRSDLGSVLTLEKSENRIFTVKATIGLGEFIKPGDRIDFDGSIAKYAVINRSPLVVADIEKDKRFGRANLSHYGTKSFVCLPIKTSKEIIGVLTISTRSSPRVYGQEEIEVLTPLLSNAAFTYENLRLLRENERHCLVMGAVDKISQTLNSSFRDSELLQSVLIELHGVLQFERAAVLVRDETQPGSLRVKELMSLTPCPLLKNDRYSCAGSIIEQAFMLESTMILERPGPGSSELDRLLFDGLSSRCCMVAPLKTGGALLGALVFIGDRREALGAAQGLAGWVGSGLALAIDRNRLKSAVIKRDQEMQTIRQVGSALASSTFDITKVLNYTMELVREVLSVEAGFLAFLREMALEVAVAFNRDSSGLPTGRMTIGQGIAGYAAARGESVIVNDPEKSPHLLHEMNDDPEFRTRSALCVPMISQGRVIGVIEVLNKVSGHFDANDRDLLQAIATSVCIALENARLYKETVAAAEHERDIRRIFQKFVPKEVVDKIIHGLVGGKPVMEELKTVTLLNIDIRGFSTLARTIGSRRMVGLLNRFFAAMGDIVFNHHGIVDKYLGDGFLSLFGAPVSTVDDAENAIAAALEMQAALDRVNLEWRRECGLNVAMGISIHTGEVVAGNIGFEKKMDYTVVGDSVNTVFRLQALSKAFPNGIIASDQTLRTLRQPVDSEEIAVPADLQAELSGVRVYLLRRPCGPAAGAACDRPCAAAGDSPTISRTVRGAP